MRNEAVEDFETRLAGILGEIDALLEARDGARFRRHPARPAQGGTANPQYDGLFSVIANFSAGIGSEFGPGYTLTVRASTLDPVPDALREAWETLAAEHLRKRLPEVFPGRSLSVDRDRHGWKLHGDLSLR